MYISYFNYVKDNPVYMDKVVSIAAYPPRYIKSKIETVPELAPPRNIFLKRKNNEITPEKYFELYYEQLEKLGLNFLEQLQGKILCCHCKEVLGCHRFLVSSYYDDLTGMFIPELGMDIKKHMEDYIAKHNL